MSYGAKVYEQLMIQAPDYQECHVRWHSCICLLYFHKLEPVAHSVHQWLRDIGIKEGYNG